MDIPYAFSTYLESSETVVKHLLGLQKLLGVLCMLEYLGHAGWVGLSLQDFQNSLQIANQTISVGGGSRLTETDLSKRVKSSFKRG